VFVETALLLTDNAVSAFFVVTQGKPCVVVLLTSCANHEITESIVWAGLIKLKNYSAIL